MNERVYKILVRTLVAIVVVIGFIVAGVVLNHEKPMPSCTEDEIIVGHGSYYGETGRWSSYGCSHPDILGGTQ